MPGHELSLQRHAIGAPRHAVNARMTQIILTYFKLSLVLIDDFFSRRTRHYLTTFLSFRWKYAGTPAGRLPSIWWHTHYIILGLRSADFDTRIAATYAWYYDGLKGCRLRWLPLPAFHWLLLVIQHVAVAVRAPASAARQPYRGDADCLPRGFCQYAIFRPHFIIAFARYFSMRFREVGRDAGDIDIYLFRLQDAASPCRRMMAVPITPLQQQPPHLPSPGFLPYNIGECDDFA